MAVNSLPKFHVISDSREQCPLIFKASEYCEGSSIVALKTGDYTLRGLEDKFVIERKGSLVEWSGNILQTRFVNELERLNEFEHPYIILCFSVDDLMHYPYSTNIPKYKLKYIKVTPELLLMKTLEFSVKYKVKIIFAGIHGQAVCLSLFKRIWKHYYG